MQQTRSGGEGDTQDQLTAGDSDSEGVGGVTVVGVTLTGLPTLIFTYRQQTDSALSSSSYYVMVSWY